MVYGLYRVRLRVYLMFENVSLYVQGSYVHPTAPHAWATRQATLVTVARAAHPCTGHQHHRVGTWRACAMRIPWSSTVPLSEQ